MVLQSKILAALTNKDDDNKDNYKETFEEIVWWDKRINQWNKPKWSLYYFKDNTARQRFDDFNNDIKRFEKIKSSEMKLEEKTNAEFV